MSDHGEVPGATPRITTVSGVNYWIRDSYGHGRFHGWFVNRENPPGPEWCGRPWWTQIAGPFTSRPEARKWLHKTI